MQILAIDPGTTDSAWVLYDTVTRTLSGFAKESNEIVLNKLDLADFPVTPDICVIEYIELWQNAGGETVDTIFWSGRFAQAWGTNFETIKRRQVKKALLGRVNGMKDKDIRAAVIAELGEPGTKAAPGTTYGVTADVWQALGLAIAWEKLKCN